MSSPRPNSPELPAGKLSTWRQLGLVVLLAVGSYLALSVDLPLAQYLAAHPLHGDLKRLVSLGEVFGYGLTAGLIWVAVWVLDPAGRDRWWWGAGATLAAGGVAMLAKAAIPRVRPRALHDLLHVSLAELQSVSQTFLGYSASAGSDSGRQSFPSGHAAVAAGLAVSLSVLYPRGKWLFAGLAGLACFQRVQSEAHFLSDVLAGAAIGTLMATLVLQVAGTRRLASQTGAENSHGDL